MSSSAPLPTAAAADPIDPPTVADRRASGGVARPATNLLDLGRSLGRRFAPSARIVAEPSNLIPIATALIAAVLLLFLDDKLDGMAEVGLRLTISAAIVGIVLRQSILLSDRRAAVERERAATLRAEEASAGAVRSAQLLAVAEARFRGLVEQIPAAVYLDRLDMAQLSISETVYASPRIEEVTGYSPAEVAADNDLWLRRIHEDDQAACLVEWERHCTLYERLNMTYRFRRKDDRIVWLEEDAHVIEGDNGARYSQGMILDVTEKRETEARLRQVQKMEAVGQLAGGVAHDFNNLLTVITGHAELLRETTGDHDPARVDIDAISAAAASSADLVGQLLAFGRRTMLRPELVDLSVAVNDVLPMLRRLLPEHIEVITRLDPDLPAVRADPGQVQQVVLNLAINGRDAMPAGGMLSLATEARTVSPAEASHHLGLLAGSYVLLTITDQGTGMDAATRDRIFEPFFTTKAAGRGTGLGLATVYGIVKQSGGYISLDSVVDRGSTFEVFLPATAVRAVSPRPPTPVRTPHGQERILLCEDEPAVRDLVAAVLRRFGYVVVVATNPAEALLAVADRQAPIDLLLSDVVMPAMSGPDLARRAVSMRPDLRVVLMSGYAIDDADREAIGRAAFLAKPFTPAELARTIRDALDGTPDGDAPVIQTAVAARG